MTGSELLLGVATVVIAFLYSSVGHAGASGYLVVLVMAGTSASELRPSSLLLNVAVSFITATQFLRRGHWSARIFLPCALASIPFAVIGGMISLPSPVLHTLIGLVLVYSAVMIIARPREADIITEPPVSALVLLGGTIGLFSGMIGVGGGIFLTPLLITFRWAKTRVAAGLSSVFILVNSLAGMIGMAYSGNFHLSGHLPVMAISAVIGGSFGAAMGSGRFSVVTLKRILAAVLIFAGGKLIFQ